MLSITDDLFTAEGLSTKLEFYLKEGCQLGAQRIKMNIGNLEGIRKVSVEQLTNLLDEYQLSINIENDQTEANGTFAFVAEALKRINESDLPISYTFDA